MVYALEEALKSKFKDVRLEGKMEGRIEAILDLLEELGDIPESLEKTIRSETNLETLRIWFKQAAKARSIEEFKEMAGLN